MLVKKSPYNFLHISNSLTYLSLFSSVISIYISFKFKNINLAYAFLSVSIMLDLFDGKFANLFKRDSLQKEFGIQIDSLIDTVAFGLVTWISCAITQSYSLIFWVNGLFFSICAVTRLGYFNLQSMQNQNTYTGLTTTLAALIWIVITYFSDSELLLNIFLFFISIAMISSFKYPKPKPLVFLFLITIIVVFGILHFVKGLK